MFDEIENPENKENQRNFANIHLLQKKKNVITKKKTFFVPKKQKPKCRSVTNSNNSLVQKLQNPGLKKPKKIVIKKPIEEVKSKINVAVHYSEAENSNLFYNYGFSTYNYAKYLDNETKIKGNFLSSQQVSQEIHIKMIDWMVEVLTVYNSPDETYFLAVRILDTFIAQSKDVVKTEHIHLLGITSMFIASKFEDVTPIRLYCFAEKIGHRQFDE